MSENCDVGQKIEALEQQVAGLKYGNVRRGVRRRSTKHICGLPVYDIALGPDPEKSELRGHARGILAIGDIATGVFAIGGVARGLVALGGITLGVFSVGGCSIGILVGVGGVVAGALAIGGLAVGLVALGGVVVGIIAAGGVALGYYACGGVAFGNYVISAMEQDPEAIRFFGQWIPGINQLAQPLGR